PAHNHVTTPSLHDALPIFTLNGSGIVRSAIAPTAINQAPLVNAGGDQTIDLPASVELLGSVVDDGLVASGVDQWRLVDRGGRNRDRKSTRLNSSHLGISYA